MHRHYRVALITGAVAAAGVGLVAFAAAAPAAAAVVGAGAGGLGLYAGGHWARRKLGLGGSGRKWRAPRTRPATGGKVPGKGLRLPLPRGRAGSGGGLKLPKPKLPSLRSRSGAGQRSGFPRLGRGRATAMRAPKGRGRTGAGKRPPPVRGGGRSRSLLPRVGARKGAGKTPRLGSRRGGRVLPRLGKGAGPRLPSLRPRPSSPGKRSKQRNPARYRSGGLGIRRIKKGKRKGQWQKYTQRAPVPPWRKGLAATAETVGAPFFLAFLAGRWAWRKARRRRQPAAQPAPVIQAPEPAPLAPVPSPVPKTSHSSRTGRPLHDLAKGPHIMNHIDAAAEAAEQHIGSWAPENATDLDLFLAGLPRYFEAVSGAFRTVAERLADGYPVHPSVPERLREIGSTIGGMADFSGEAHASHRAMHEKELERLESPRRNEQFWDVTENR